MVARSLSRAVLVAAAAALLLALGTARGEAAAASGAPLSCCTIPTQDFAKVGGNYGNQNHTGLTQIDRRSISKLGAAWHANLEGGSTEQSQQSTVVAVGGVLYVETTQGRVLAVDGRTGAIRWRYAPADAVAGGYGSMRRGVAVGAGKVFSARADRRVFALKQDTGELAWERQFTDEKGIFSIKAAAVYYDGMVLISGGDGPRGVALALDAETGRTLWKFYGTPAPGEFGNDTWEGDSWQTGGASPWMHPAIDPQLGLVYWTFGNARAGGAVDGSQRAGQNLFANSLVALDARTGKRVWHFQSVHHDIWDMDNVMAPVLADVRVKGTLRKAVVYGSKTGMLYVLDRRTGEPLTPIDERPVPQEPAQKTWPTQPFPRGDSLVPLCPGKSGAQRVPPHYQSGCLFTPHLNDPVVQAPGTGGGGDWSALSFSPRTGLVYVGIGYVNSAHSIVDGGIGFRPLGEERSGGIVAFDPATHRVAWRREMPWALAHGNGILSTASGLLFVGQPDGVLLGLDGRDGRELWRFQTGAGVHTSPVSYEIDGQQYLAVFAGGNGLPYNSPTGDYLWAFRLGGTDSPASAPRPPSIRQPITAAAVDGTAVDNTVQIARTWSGRAAGTAENTTQRAMAPQRLRVPAGTRVTFLNPEGNRSPHCVTQFFEGLFDSGPLQPGQSFSYVFDKPGEYYYNDCTSPRTTGVVEVH